MRTTESFARLLPVVLVLTFVISTLAACSRKEDAASDASPIASDVPPLAFEKFTLPNGLEVIVSENHRLPLVAVSMWYHVGPANEEPGRTGFAHLFEHLAFGGSKHVPRGLADTLLEAAGGTDMNGTTASDRTNYFHTVPSNQLELVLWLEADRMGYMIDAIDQAALSNQQDVVRNERRQSTENQPYGLAHEALVQQLVPPGHPYYGNIIGSHADIQAAKLEDVKQFFKRYYAPNNASLAIVGDVDPAQVRALVTKYFGSLKRGPAVPPVKVDTPKISTERRAVVKDRIQLPRIYMGWITPPIYKSGDAEADVLSVLLGGGRSSRLYKKLVYEKQIAQDVAAEQESRMLGSQFTIVATARPGSTLEELERAIDEELEALRTRGPDAAEVERARNLLETSTFQSLEKLGGMNGVAERLNTYNHYLGDPDFLQKDIGRYRAVTPASVLAFAREHLPVSARAVVQVVSGEPAVGPPVPAQPVRTKSSGAESVNDDEPWRKTIPKAAPAKPFRLPTPESAQLPNGLTLILSERKGLPIVAVNLALKTGSDANPPNAPGLASFTAGMLDEGTQTRRAPQIADELAQLGAGLGAGSATDTSSVAAFSLKKHLPAALDILADVVLRPAFPAAEIERQRASRLAALAQQRDDAGAIAAKTVAAVLYGERHPYGHLELGTVASVKSMTREAMMAFWQQNFVPNNAALVVAGDITMKELRALADQAFGSWKPGTPARPVLPAPSTAPARLVIVDRPGAPQTELRVVTIGAARSTPDYYALEVLSSALGGQFSRLNQNLREVHGYSYGAYSGFDFRKAPGPFAAQSAVQTGATAPAVIEVFKELRAIAQSPMAPEELQRSKDALSRSLSAVFQTSASEAGVSSGLYIYDLGLDYFTHVADRVNAVTAQQTLAAAQKYLVPETMTVVAVGDRKKIEADLRKLKLGASEIRDAEGRPVK